VCSIQQEATNDEKNIAKIITFLRTKNVWSFVGQKLGVQLAPSNQTGIGKTRVNIFIFVFILMLLEVRVVLKRQIKATASKLS
jgi:hypothetical protein